LAHLRKVYTLVGVSAGAAALGGLGATAIGIGGGLAMVMGLGALAPLLGALMMNPAKVLLRQNLLIGAAAMMGIGAGPLLGAVGMPAILMALGGTGAIFAGFSLAALKAPSGSYLKFGGVMMGGVLVILAAALLSMFGGALGIPASILAGLSSLNLYGGLLLMSLFVAYDTQSMIDRAASGDSDHVSDAVNMFIDVWGIFIRLLASTYPNQFSSAQQQCFLT
jgi:FtsH-binding integral membrane protein